MQNSIDEVRNSTYEVQNRIQEGSFWLLAGSHIGVTTPTEYVSFATANDTNSNWVENVNT